MAEDVALRKRQLISQANRMMFIWVAVASALVSFALVVGYFMVVRMNYNHTVIGQQSKSIDVIKKNKEATASLKKSIAVLNTSEKLYALKANEDDEPAQVILDALPAKPNSAGLGASLLSDKLVGKSGVTIETMTVTPIAGVEDAAVDASADAAAAPDAAAADSSAEQGSAISFSFTVSVTQGQAEVLKTILKDMERSIRALNVKKLKIENQQARLTMTVDGEGYYQTEANLELHDKEVPRK